MCEIERLILSQALVVLRNHDFELIALRDNTGNVPLVSIATVKRARCSASISALSSCNIGSPPVKTTKRRASCGGHSAAIIAASASAVLYLPPFSPSSPTKSVSQKRHIAPARSSSRPDHRLHPANRHHTAERPAFAPSPCNV